MSEQANPWAVSPEAEQTQPADPWGSTAQQPENEQLEQDTAEQGSAWGQPQTDPQTDQSNDWLSQAGEQQLEQKDFSWADPFDSYTIPLDDWVDDSLQWVVSNFRDVFQSIRVPVDATLTSIEQLLQGMPPLLVIAIFVLLAWQVSTKKLAIATFFSFLAIGLIGAWSQAMVTLALVFTSVLFSLLIGLPLGIWMGKSDRVELVIKPILDAMQTTPAFVYLVPIVMLFGIGNVPGVVVTIIFALPPLIRLTSLGIRQVPADLIEAGQSFGASPRQMLFKVELPVAMPTIMAGVNQNLMLSLSMVVIASMIAVGGLGQMVLRGIGRLDMGLAAVGGLAIVLLAIVLDRMTQALGKQEQKSRVEQWYYKGPVGLLVRGYTRITSK